MSTWGIGDHHDSDEVQSLKGQVRSKDAQFDTLRSQLLKREDGLRQAKVAYDDVVGKLRQEADRVLELEATVSQQNKDLQNECITRQNTESAFSAIQQKLKDAEQTSHELQAIVDTLSRGAQSSALDKGALEKENMALKSRVRTLQADLAAKERLEQAPLRQSQNAATGARGRPRSSSVSTFRVTALERESADLHTQVAQKTTELREAKAHASRMQDALIKRENEMIAMEKQLHRELEEAKSELKDCQEELSMIQGSDGADAAAREASLLERLEDEERRVAMLEAELRRSGGGSKKDLAMLLDEVQRTSGSLQQEKAKLEEAEARVIELVSEKETALDERDQAVAQIQDMQDVIRDLEARASNSQRLPVPSSPGRDEKTAAMVEPLLEAITRLRGERDSLRHERDELKINFDFLNDESRFTIEDLRTKLTAAQTVPSGMSAVHPVREIHLQGTRNKAVHQARISLVLALVAQHVEGQREQGLMHIMSLSQALSVARGELQQAHSVVSEKEAYISSLENALASKDVKIREVHASLAGTTQNLHLAESNLAACKDIIQSLEEERARFHDAEDDVGTSLAEAVAQLNELSKALADAEAQRDALALQVQHTEQDLSTARQELAAADDRLAQQLRSLSSGAADQVLREQVKALEDRVLRRTEQIGVHQHDIKRLETNMRLQEERLVEMSAELEVLMGEKEAMVEDCKASREERDEARARCEEMEEKAESAEEDNDKLKATLEEAKEEGGRLEREVKTLMRRQAEQDARNVELDRRLSEIARERDRLSQDADQLNANCDGLAQALDEKTRLALSLRDDLSSLEQERAQITVALAMVLTVFRTTELSCQCAHDARNVAQRESAILGRNIEEKTVQIACLHQQLDALRDLQAAAEDEKESRLLAEQTRLQEELQSLQSTHSDLRSTHEQQLQELAHDQEELQQKLAHGAETESDLRNRLSSVEQEKANVIRDLQVQLDSVATELRCAREAHDRATASHKEAKDAMMAVRQELEDQLADAMTRLHETCHVEEELTSLRSNQLKELDELRSQLGRTMAELGQTTIEHKEMEAKYENTVGEVESLKAQLSDKARACEEAGVRLAELQDGELEELRTRLQEITADMQEVDDARSKIEERYRQLSEESSQATDELQNQLTSALDEMDYLKATLQGEMDMHVRKQKEHEDEIRAAKMKTVEAERMSEELRQELSALRTQLEEADASLQTLENERTALQFEATSVEAEMQRLKSLQRYLESQVKESEGSIRSLTSSVDEARARLLQTEKALQAAEATASMREIQQEQTINALRRDLQALRSNPSLEEKIIDLEERNQEMEELLKNKCIEIEENDDRFIEMLKEKKKLTSKVETLTRKLHALQSKVASNEAVSKVATVEAGPSAPALRSSRSSPAIAPQLSSARSSERIASSQPPLPTPIYTPTTPNLRSRMASGPSALPRPKTPESRTLQPAVFRVRTPEMKRASSHTAVPPIPPMPVASSSMSTTSTAGKKRRAPDDFDDCESLPPQGFTADCLPLHASTTPRARKALQTVRTGFTPVRSHAAQLFPTQLSPRRVSAVPSVIADVTNSPRGKSEAQSEATAKRGWLGKIRSGPTSGQRAVSSRPVFERR